MKCRECVKEGKTSRLYGGDSCFTTCMRTQHYYDESGTEHIHDPNGSTYTYSCSEGHRYSVTTYSPCPQITCEWNVQQIRETPSATTSDDNRTRLK
jgi:hypothetical protein